jgi:hypothetical protein
VTAVFASNFGCTLTFSQSGNCCNRLFRASGVHERRCGNAARLITWRTISFVRPTISLARAGAI